MGVSLQAYSSWERGTRGMSGEALIALSRLFDVSTDEIMGLDVRRDYTDPREAELHRMWVRLSQHGRGVVMSVARGQMALERKVDDDA
jgi:transcriptional regulator with XRE-family HTH domain